MRRSSLLLLVPALLIGGGVAATVWRLSRIPDVGPTAPEVAVQTETVGAVRFEFEYRPGSESFEVVRSADAIGVRRGDDRFEFRHGIPVVNGTTFPSPAAGQTVRWNLDGPLLINHEPVAPHRFQPRPLDAPPTELKWDIKNPSDAPRDSLTADWSRVGRVLVTAHGDGVVRVWDVDKGTVRTEITPPAPTDGRKRWGFKAAVSADGKMVAAANVQASAVTLWEAETGKLIATLTEPAGKVTDVRFAPDGILLEARGGTIYGRSPIVERSKVEKLVTGRARDVEFLFAGSYTVIDERTVTVTQPPQFNSPPGGFPFSFRVDSVPDEGHVAVSPDGTTIAFAGRNTLALHGVRSDRLARALWWRSTPISALAFLADGKTLAVGAADGLRLYDVESGRERGWVQTLSIRSLAVSGDGTFLAASMEHGPAVLLWRTADLQPR